MNRAIRQNSIVLKSGRVTMWTSEANGNVEQVIYVPRLPDTSMSTAALELVAAVNELYGPKVRFEQRAGYEAGADVVSGEGVLLFDKLWARTGTVRAFVIGREAWIFVAAGTDEAFASSEPAAHFLSSLAGS